MSLVSPARLAARVRRPSERSPAAPETGTDRAGLTLVWVLVVAALALADAFAGEAWVPRATGWAAPAMAVLAGYGYVPGLSWRALLDRWVRGLVMPYVAWLVLLAGPVLVAESVRAGAPAREHALSLLGGRRAFGPPLAGHWLLGGLLVGLLLLHVIEKALAVDPVWVLPAALALSHGAPFLVPVPLHLGLGLVLLTWLVLGRLLAVAQERARRHARRRPRRGPRGGSRRGPHARPHAGPHGGARGSARGRRRLRWWAAPALGLVAAAAVVGGPPLAAAGVVAPRDGQTGMAILGPLAAGCAGIVLIVLAAGLARLLPPGVRRVLDGADRVRIVALTTYGLGLLAPPSWPRGAVLAACLAAAASVCALCAVLPRTGWLTGSAPSSGRPSPF